MLLGQLPSYASDIFTLSTCDLAGELKQVFLYNSISGIYVYLISTARIMLNHGMKLKSPHSARQATITGFRFNHLIGTLSLLCSLAATPSAWAAPMYYTFSGTVNWGPIDDLDMIPTSSNPFGYGDAVSMIWEVDLAALAETTDLTTGATTLSPAHGYARLISGGMLNPTDVGLTSFDGVSTKAFFGANSSPNNAYLQNNLTTLSGDSYFVEIRNDDGATVADYYAGATGFSVYERVIQNGSATRYQVLDTLTLTSITSAPVPEQSSTGLMLVCLMALMIGTRRRPNSS